MYYLNHVFSHVRHYKTKHSLLYTLVTMIFFWSIFDAVLSYFIPILIIQHSYSKTQMGLLIGSSSFFGAVFDIFFSKFVKTPRFRSLYIAMFVLSTAFLVVLYTAHSIWFFILAMLLWGIYWDLFHFANFDFMSTIVTEYERPSSFGLLVVLQSLGITIAPLLAGLVIGSLMGTGPFVLSLGMLTISFMFFLNLLASTRIAHVVVPVESERKNNWLTEFHLWKKISRRLIPLLVLTFFLYVVDAFFWTLGPLLALQDKFGSFGGFILVAYTVPFLFGGLFLKHITVRYEHRHIAFICFSIASVLIVLLSTIAAPLLVMALIFAAAFFLSLSLPTVNALYSNYIADERMYEKEIEGLADFFYNLGWMIGPIAAGLLSDAIGISSSFTVLGVIGCIVGIVLFRITK
ncbi:MAG: MFS transporter [Candidatus Roizmanbacteria bacterium]|nr:MFS transporter [Candidatus Roizmanbacteria bacterium]